MSDLFSVLIFLLIAVVLFTLDSDLLDPDLSDPVCTVVPDSALPFARSGVLFLRPCAIAMLLLL